MNKPNYLGLTKQEYIKLLKECGMCTKKWTSCKRKEFDKKRKEIINARRKPGIIAKTIKKIKGGNNNESNN